MKMYEMAFIDQILMQSNLRQNTLYRYIIGNCLFAFVSYLLNHELSSISLRMNIIYHLEYCLYLNTSKAQETHHNELNPKWIHDLHIGFHDEYQYIQRMYVSATQGGIWDDFTSIKWVFDYSQRPVYI